MNIPQGFLELGIAAIIGFVFKVVFGLITKNEQKSDEADLRIEGEIKQLRREMKEMDDRYRSNDRELYKQCSDIASSITGIKSQLDCIKGKA